MALPPGRVKYLFVTNFLLALFFVLAVLSYRKEFARLDKVLPGQQR